MVNAKMVCRVCGKEYEACHTLRVGDAFRWQDVACSVECGAEYLRRVLEARTPVEEQEAEPSEEISEIVEALPFEEEEEEEVDEEETEEDEIEE